MPETYKIPVFPLPVVIFPEEELNLHIYEKRYIQLINECRDSGMVFTILPVIDDQIQNIGAIVKLIEISNTYTDGRMDIKLKAIGKLRKLDYYDKWTGKLYGAVDAETLDDESTGLDDLILEVKTAFNKLCDINKAKPYHSINWESFTSYKLGHYVGFTLKEEYHFNSCESENDRLSQLLNQIKFMISQSLLRQEWLKNMSLNGEFRNFDKATLR